MYGGDHSRRSCGLYWNDLLLPSENRLGAGTVFSAVQQVGAEQAKLNLTTKFAQESTGVGMLVFVVFITLWLGLRKSAEDRRG